MNRTQQSPITNRLTQSTSSNREAVSLEHCTIGEATRHVLTDHGHSIVTIGCPIDGHVGLLHNNAWHLWKSHEPDVLVNALGPKHGLVDRTVAWAPTVQALNADRTQLVVAVPDLEGHSLHGPANLGVINVEVAGELIDFTTDHPDGSSQWAQLHHFVNLQFAHAVHRGEGLDVHPIQDERNEHPTVSAWAEPDNETDVGFGFGLYVDGSPTAGDDMFNNDPIAPSRYAAIWDVGAAICVAAYAWDLSPLNVRMSVFPHARGELRTLD